MSEKGCPFCAPQNIFLENELAVAIPDKYPKKPGHTLVILKRHTHSFFELTDDELLACYDLVKRVKALLDERYSPGGYKVGANIGKDSGQTIMHVHIHVLPMGGETIHDREEL